MRTCRDLASGIPFANDSKAIWVRLWVDLLVLEFNDLNDPAAPRDQPSDFVAANRANERIRYTEPKVSTVCQEFQGPLDEQHVEIELPATRRLKPSSVLSYLRALASM